MSAFGGGPKDDILNWLKVVQVENRLSDQQLIAAVLAVLAYLAESE